MDSVNKLAQQAIELRPTERIKLVEAILYSLDKPNPEIEKSWVAESEARYEAYKRGELDAIDWDEIKKRYTPWKFVLFCSVVAEESLASNCCCSYFGIKVSESCIY